MSVMTAEGKTTQNPPIPTRIYIRMANPSANQGGKSLNCNQIGDGCSVLFAPLLQRAFLAGLDRSRSELLSGHIHAANLPSLRTALRCGRIDAGGWVFLS